MNGPFRLALSAAMGLALAAMGQPAAAQVAAANSANQSAPATKAETVASPPPTPGSPAAAAPGSAPPAANQPPPPPPSFTTSGPFSFSAAMTADVLGDVAGGLTRGVKLLTKTNVSASYDGSGGNMPGWSGQATLQYVKGGHISGDDVGDVQGIDSIEAYNGLRLYELWIEKQWADGKYGLKFGFTDLNVDFDTQQVAALFLNSSDGIGPEFGHSGLNGPSVFPTTTLALSGFAKPGDSWTLRAGLFNGLAGSTDHPGDFVALHISDRTGALIVIQAEHASATGLRTYVSGWAYTADFDALHAVDANGNPLQRARMHGVFGLVEGQIAGGGSGPTLSGWLRVGLGDPVVERISGYVGCGVVATGLIKSRAEDQSGISINHAIVDEPGLPPSAIPAKRAETAIELTYRVQARDWLSVQPDLQYVHRPNGDPTIPSALVVGVRLSVNLTDNLLRKIKGDQ